jgi:hypothetical protein
MADNLRLLVERVNLRIQLLSLLFVIVGFASMFASPSVEAAGYHKIAALLHEGGAALVISGALAALWELAGKRAFADEVLAKANMSRDLAEAGIDVVTYSFKDDRISWEQLFKNACRLDVFVSYAHTWRNTQVERIDKLLSDNSAVLRVVLPDPDDKGVLTSLADRFEMQPEDVRRSIEEGKGFFEHRKRKAKGTVEIYFSSIVPLFSFYRFNNKAVFALYNHRKGRLPVPSFVCDSDGFLFKYISEELEGILADKQRTRRIDIQEAGPSNPSRAGRTDAQ